MDIMKRIRNTIFVVAIIVALLYVNWQGQMVVAKHPQMYMETPFL